MASTGKVIALIQALQGAGVSPEAIKTAVAEWLAENVDPETGYVLDKTLSIEGAAADAKAAGDACNELKSAIRVNHMTDYSGLTAFEKIATDKRMTITGLSTFSGYDVYKIPVGNAKIIQIFGTDAENPWYGTLNASYRLIIEKKDGTKTDYSSLTSYARPVNQEYLVLVQANIAVLYVNVKQGTEKDVLVYTDRDEIHKYGRNVIRLTPDNTIKSMIYRAATSLGLNQVSGTAFASLFTLWKYVHAGDSVVIFGRASGVSVLGTFTADNAEAPTSLGDYAIASFTAPQDGYINLFTDLSNIADAVFVPNDDADCHFFNGKKLTFLGDSITYRWQWEPIVLAYCGGTGYNCGIGSTPLSGDNENAYWQDVRLNAVKETDPDVLFILGGANDASMNPTIGTDANLTDKDTSTFIGAYSYIIDTLLTWKPSLKIVILSTTYTKNANIGDFAAASKKVAEYYHLTYVDIFNHSGFNAYTFGDTTATQIYSTDQVHPNGAGYRIMAGIVIAKLRECFGTS